MRVALLVLAAAPLLAEEARVLRHRMVYQESGRFGGWPANHGLWQWGDEILVGFSAAWHQKKDADRHQADSDRPEEPRLARSLDGGESWLIEAPRSLLPPEQGGQAVTALREPLPLQAAGFAMTLRFTSIHKGPSRLWYSADKGKTWNGPYAFPMLGQQGIAARTDYVVLGPREALWFLTAAKSNGREGRPLLARTQDGGLTWNLVSFIGPEPPGFSIMPSSLLLGPRRLLTTVRVKELGDGDTQRNWIDAWLSEDGGQTWNYRNRPVPDTGGRSGNPPHLIRLRDGRLCLTYGYRSRPYGIRARLSADEGATWGPEISLRDDAAAWDLGYVRSAQRRDGHIVSVYYFNDGPHSERFIAATIWHPGTR